MGLQAMCKHPNIVEILDSYMYGNDVCIVMELIPGSSLTNVLGTKVDFPEACIAYVCREVLQGLQCVHDLRLYIIVVVRTRHDILLYYHQLIHS